MTCPREIIAEALRHPITIAIAQRKKPRLVLLSVEHYRKLLDRAENVLTSPAMQAAANAP